MPLKEWGLAKTLRRLLLYLCLALASLVVLGLVIAVSNYAHLAIPFRWVALIMYTSLLLYAVIKEFRRLWRHVPFWLSLAGLLAIHLLAFVAVLRAIPQWRLLWFIPVVYVESILFSTVLDLLFTWRPKRTHRPSNPS
jgi:hypothetical protein